MDTVTTDPPFLDRIGAACDLIHRYGGIEGEHHKQWLLDQVLRLLLEAENYGDWVSEYNSETDEAGERYSPWDTGIAP